MLSRGEAGSDSCGRLCCECGTPFGDGPGGVHWLHRRAGGDNQYRMMDYLRGLAILVGFQMLGLLLHRVGVPIPGGVLGLLAFYLALTAGLIKLRWVERAAGLLLRHMVLLFVPLTVGLMDMGSLLSKQAVAITASLLVSLTAVLLTTGLLGRWLLPTEPILPGLVEDDAAETAAEGAGR